MKIKLNNGLTVNQLALGTFRSKPDDAYSAVKYALKAGYRHIDTAAIYRNEKEVGMAVRDSGIQRKDIFVTTKIWNTEQGYETTKVAFQKALDELEFDYIDLVLIHWPKTFEKTKETWRALEEIYASGKAKAIGVSNFKIHDIMVLLETAKVIPVVNQVELHVGLQNHRLKEYCDQFGIVLEAYAPLMSHKIENLLSNEVLIEIAKKHEVTVPQVAIKWILQRGIIALPKSVHEERIISNFKSQALQLDKQDMADIRKLNKAIRYFPDSDNTDF